MKNFDSDYFFKKEIKIVGSPQKFFAEKSDALDFQFFPEGGNLIAGLKNNVAFKAIGSNGLSRQVKIVVRDNEQTEVARATTNSLGMGVMIIAAVHGKHYSALVEGSNQKFDLPNPVASGFLIAVTNKKESDEIFVRVQSTESTPNRSHVTLVAHSRGKIGYMASSDLSKNLYFFKIAKEKLLHGIAHLTLFDAMGKPAAERLTFVDQLKPLAVSLSTVKQTFKPREKIQLNLKVVDATGKGVAGNFSLAVTDDSQMAIPPGSETISSSLLLSSDLRGYIENPGYYFNSENADARQALDVLLLTQGWRRFTWDKILDDKWPEIKFPIDQGLTVSGKMLDELSKKPIAGGKVVYLATATSNLNVTSTDDNGIFKFENVMFPDTAEVVLQGETKRGNKAVVFEIKEPGLEKINFSIPGFSTLPSDEQSYYLGEYQKRRTSDHFSPDGAAITLKAVEVSASRIVKQETTRMYGNGSKTINLKDYPSTDFAVHPLQLVQGRMAGVQVSGSGSSYSVTIRGAGSISGSSTPYIMIDNVPVDISTLNMIRTQDIESVSIFKGADAAVFGSKGANGAILFYTKRGGYTASKEQGIFNIRMGGYATSKEFYSPKYDVSSPETAAPDYRATIFWAPNVRTDSTGMTAVSFYNNDNETSVTCVLDGVSDHGITATSRFGYSVKK
jgi:TonB-dependent SusC/RagA subfamily outer membrane receptor